MTRIRLMTYNVHGCRGSDRRLRPERILALLERCEPDVVALQELDVGQHRANGFDQAAFFARQLGMELYFVAARPKDGGHYGNALLTRLPSQLLRAGGLPRLHDGCEARAAQCVRVERDSVVFDIINTHLGLVRHERRIQAESLLGEDWLLAPGLSQRAVLCGDLNSAPGSFVYGRLCSRLLDVQRIFRLPKPTFPALFPILRIDHVFARGLLVERVEVPSGALARLASDHRPLIADLVSNGESEA